MDDNRDNIHPMPLRADLPPEIAALALPGDENEDPVVVLNANEKDLRATYNTFRLAALASLTWGWIVERGDWIRDHPGTAAASLASSVAGGALALSLQAGVDPETPLAYPPQTITVAASPVPSMASTTRPTPRPTRSKKTVAPTWRPSPKAPAPPVDDMPERAPRPTAPTFRPSVKATSAVPTPSKDPTLDAPQEAGNEPDPPATTRTTETPDDPPTTQPPASTQASGRDCVIRVDVDPLLDVGVLC